MDAVAGRQAPGEDDQARLSSDHASPAQGSRLPTRPRPRDSQTGEAKMKGTSPMELITRIHIEDGSYWADVPELPGCFASGHTLDDLFKSLQEGIALYLADDGEHSGPLHVAAATLTDGPLA